MKSLPHKTQWPQNSRRELLLFPKRFPAQLLALWGPLPRLSIPQPKSTNDQTDGLEAHSTYNPPSQSSFPRLSSGTGVISESLRLFLFCMKDSTQPPGPPALRYSRSLASYPLFTSQPTWPADALGYPTTIQRSSTHP